MTATATRPTAEDRIRAALWFAERGFGIFTVWSTTSNGVCRCPKGAACDNAGKHPITPNGFHDATTDPDRIRTLLSAGSEPNYGLVCPDNVFALDVDGAGITRLAELEQQYGPLPPTLRTTTANGEHVFLRWPAELPRPLGHLFGFVTRWGSGRDAGYVIGPRSVHASGAVYAPTGTPEIAEMPEQWARAAVEAKQVPAGTIIVGGAGYQLPDRVPPSESRYEAIRTYTAHLYNRGFTTDEMWLQVRDQLAPRFEQPLAEHEVRARFDRTTASLGPRLGDPRNLPPEPVDPSTFPVPEDRGLARLSNLGEVEYVEDLIRPGRIVVWAAQEGSGKSYAVTGELAIRLAVAGGSFAGVWPICRQGPVLVLSEMHPDDDYNREQVVMQSLELTRQQLQGRYFRLSLMTAAGGKPALMVPEWRAWVTDWLRDAGALLLVVDTATGATQVKPWGEEIQGVYRSLRMMLEAYPALSIVLIVHVRKPMTRGDRDLSDVLGEWGRWCDVVVLQENDGKSLERAKISVRKRVKRERRILATKAGGLLVDHVDMAAGADAKVAPEQVLATIRDHPGSTYEDLGTVLGVSSSTVSRYVKDLGDAVVKSREAGRGGAMRVSLASDALHALHHDVAERRELENDAHHALHEQVAERGANQADDARHSSRSVTGTLQSVETGPPSTTPNPSRSDEGDGLGEVGLVGSSSASTPLQSVDASDPPTPAAIDPTPTEHVTCDDYPAHQTQHVRVGAHAWACPVCHPEEIA